MAEWAGVNVNTVRAVYARLERGRADRHPPRLGSFVADGRARLAPRSSGSPPRRSRRARSRRRPPRCRDHGHRVRRPAGGARGGLPAATGPSRSSTSARWRSELELDDRGWRPTSGAARRELRRQIGRLEAELASYSRDARSPASRRTRAAPEEPRVAGHGRAGADPRRAARPARRAARAAAERPRAARAPRPRGPRRDARRPRRPPVGDRLARRRPARRAAPTWEVAPRLGPLGALMNWWRVRSRAGAR